MHESEEWKLSHSVVSDSQRPHGLQPTRLLRPWDFPRKSTGVGCHCLLYDFWEKVLFQGQLTKRQETQLKSVSLSQGSGKNVRIRGISNLGSWLASLISVLKCYRCFWKPDFLYWRTSHFVKGSGRSISILWVLWSEDSWFWVHPGDLGSHLALM